MKYYRNLTIAFLAALSLNGASTAAPSPDTAPKADDYGALDRIASVRVSPSGKQVAALVSTDGKTHAVAVWNLDDLTKPPSVIPSTPALDIQSVQFVKDDRLLLTLVQQIEVEGGRTHAYRTVITDPKGSFFQTLSIAKPGADKDKAGVSYEVNNNFGGWGNLSYVESLPRDPDRILVRDRETGDLYKVNLHISTTNFGYEKVYTGSDKYTDETWDFEGKQVRARLSYDYQDGHPYVGVFFRHPDTGAWEEHARYFVKDRETPELIGFTKDPNVVIIRMNRGQDKTALYEYSIRERKFSDALFAVPAFEVQGAIMSKSPEDYGEIIGYSYGGPTDGEVYWDDEKMAALSTSLKKALGEVDAPMAWTDPASLQTTTIQVPQTVSVEISGTSYDRKTVIVKREGPKTPPEYYVYTEGKGLKLLGRSRPQINTSAMGDLSLIQYKARDGLMLAAFVAKPNPTLWGPGPYPAIVVPHGGPWARDDWGWDVTGWTQYFVARGYVVIEPQFRTSTGWGQKIAREGDNQYGLKMSDDNDDAAAWLVSQGLAKPGHIALHGYSYGGFAAFAAGVRSANGVFRCAIAGAGVADLSRWKHYAGENKFERELYSDTMTGLNPWDHAADTLIPMLIYHGDRDQRVPIREGQGMYEKLKAAGKPVKFLVLKDMGHQVNLWSPQNFHDVLTSIEGYLNTDCGKGGISGS